MYVESEARWVQPSCRARKAALTSWTWWLMQLGSNWANPSRSGVVGRDLARCLGGVAWLVGFSSLVGVAGWNMWVIGCGEELVGSIVVTE